jgi:hypothetical protein
MKYNFVNEPVKPKKAVVITPTMGSTKLFDAMESVQQQTYADVTHLIVADGRVPCTNCSKIYLTVSFFPDNIQYTSLPFNTGHGRKVSMGIASMRPLLTL